MAELAVTFPEDLSEQEMSNLVEHAKSCSTCGAILSQGQELKRILAAFTEQDVYEDEPEFRISPRLQAALAEYELDKQLAGQTDVDSSKPIAKMGQKGDRFQLSRITRFVVVWLIATIYRVFLLIIQIAELYIEISVRAKEVRNHMLSKKGKGG